MISAPRARKDVDPKVVIGLLGIAAVAVFINYGRLTSVPTSTSPPAPTREVTVPPTQAQLVASGVTRPSQLIEMIKAAVEPKLRDPASARYTNVAAYSPPSSRGKVLFCGVVNARNGFGGYAGRRSFIAVPGYAAVFQGRPGFAKTFADLCRPAYLLQQVAGM